MMQERAAREAAKADTQLKKANDKATKEGLRVQREMSKCDLVCCGHGHCHTIPTIKHTGICAHFASEVSCMQTFHHRTQVCSCHWSQ